MTSGLEPGVELAHDRIGPVEPSGDGRHRLVLVDEGRHARDTSHERIDVGERSGHRIDVVVLVERRVEPRDQVVTIGHRSRGTPTEHCDDAAHDGQATDRLQPPGSTSRSRIDGGEERTPK